MTDLAPLANALFRGDPETIRGLLLKAQVVDDQRVGRCETRTEIDAWAQGAVEWAEGLNATHSTVASLRSDRRAVLELSLDITVEDGVVDLPFVLVADLEEGSISELRTYHSTWPYTGSHTYRRPPLRGAAADSIPEFFTRYIDQVSHAEVDAVLESFTEDGYVREPSGDRWKHQGAKDRAKFYRHLESAPRATFELNSCVESGSMTAVEYSFSYGDVPMVGGVCIMERAGDRIVAVRIADDVGA